MLRKESLHEEAWLTAEQAMDLEEERQLWSLEQAATAALLRNLATR